MYMTGYETETDFDEFARSLTLADAAARISCPYIAIAGGDDELSPIRYTFELFTKLLVPKQLVVFEGERHSIGGGMSATLGPDRHALLADWFADRFAGIPMPSRFLRVDTSGKMNEEEFPAD